MNTQTRHRADAIKRLILTVLLAVSTVNLATAQVVESDERLTMPRNYFAGDRGDWLVPVVRYSSFFPITNVTNGNLYTDKACPTVAQYTVLALAVGPLLATALIAACELSVPEPQKVWHTQHVVRLPNKNGRAYFMVAQSYKRGGWISLLQTRPDAIDGDDLLKASASGQYTWQHLYNSVNPAGSWNHPGKMEVIGGLLLVATQDWDTLLMRYSNDFEDILGGSDDAVLFYDVRDPEFPRYLGKITATDFGVPAVDLDDLLPDYPRREIDSVSVFRSPGDEWFLSITASSGGNMTHRVVKAITGGRPPYGPFVYGPTGRWDQSPLQQQDPYRATAAYGMTINSLELLHSPGERGLFFFPNNTEQAPNLSFAWYPHTITDSPTDGGLLTMEASVGQSVSVPGGENT